MIPLHLLVLEHLRNLDEAAQMHALAVRHDYLLLQHARIANVVRIVAHILHMMDGWYGWRGRGGEREGERTDVMRVSIAVRN